MIFVTWVTCFLEPPSTSFLMCTEVLVLYPNASPTQLAASVASVASTVGALELWGLFRALQGSSRHSRRTSTLSPGLGGFGAAAWTLGCTAQHQTLTSPSCTILHRVKRPMYARCLQSPGDFCVAGRTRTLQRNSLALLLEACPALAYRTARQVSLATNHRPDAASTVARFKTERHGIARSGKKSSMPASLVSDHPVSLERPRDWLTALEWLHYLFIRNEHPLAAFSCLINGFEASLEAVKTQQPSSGLAAGNAIIVDPLLSSRDWP